ncbi:uncharacterized protein LOC117227240 [Megalopta genalis]|uniref:uncharacterized protein LOC117227240 n=1 Tax=Megalopta genalis TaxID=115081 RepID=UPI003FD02B36
MRIYGSGKTEDSAGVDFFCRGIAALENRWERIVEDGGKYMIHSKIFHISFLPTRNIIKPKRMLISSANYRLRITGYDLWLRKVTVVRNRTDTSNDITAETTDYEQNWNASRCSHLETIMIV